MKEFFGLDQPPSSYEGRHIFTFWLLQNIWQSHARIGAKHFPKMSFDVLRRNWGRAFSCYNWDKAFANNKFWSTIEILVTFLPSYSSHAMIGTKYLPKMSFELLWRFDKCFVTVKTWKCLSPRRRRVVGPIQKILSELDSIPPKTPKPQNPKTPCNLI